MADRSGVAHTVNPKTQIFNCWGDISLVHTNNIKECRSYRWKVLNKVEAVNVQNYRQVDSLSDLNLNVFTVVLLVSGGTGSAIGSKSPFPDGFKRSFNIVDAIQNRLTEMCFISTLLNEMDANPNTHVFTRLVENRFCHWKPKVPSRSGDMDEVNQNQLGNFHWQAKNKMDFTLKTISPSAADKTKYSVEIRGTSIIRTSVKAVHLCQYRKNNFKLVWFRNVQFTYLRRVAHTEQTKSEVSDNGILSTLCEQSVGSKSKQSATLLCRRMLQNNPTNSVLTTTFHRIKAELRETTFYSHVSSVVSTVTQVVLPYQPEMIYPQSPYSTLRLVPSYWPSMSYCKPDTVTMFQSYSCDQYQVFH
ncbi:hypothetical protein CLF_102464 [Clonorchis sinensis]|uniref:Uncharacterized protein n=1 Tax=Clonorchis sinensis TaxID=79923 RepID=G7Y800_CLOSI|nr:hypothetical protein CLF_102464 [Clonorchis sinensis]